MKKSCKRPTPISYLQTYENFSFLDSKSSPITTAPPSGDPAYGCCGRNGLRHPECTRSSIGAASKAFNNAFPDTITIALTIAALKQCRFDSRCRNVLDCSQNKKDEVREGRIFARPSCEGG